MASVRIRDIPEDAQGVEDSAQMEPRRFDVGLKQSLGIERGATGTLTFTEDADAKGDAVDKDKFRGHEGEDAVEALCSTAAYYAPMVSFFHPLVAAARAQHAKDRAELESLQERVGQAEGYEALYRGVCEARDVLAAELEALREEEEGERVIRLESDTPLRAITPGGGIISTVMFEKGLYAIRPVEEKAKVHTMRCGICGKQFDMRDLDQVFYHEQNPHRPLTDEERALALCDSRRVEKAKVVRPVLCEVQRGRLVISPETVWRCRECGYGLLRLDGVNLDLPDSTATDQWGACPNCECPLDWNDLPGGDDE